MEFKHLINKAIDWKQDVFVNVHLLCMFGCSDGSMLRGSPQSPHSSGPNSNGYGVEPLVPSVQFVPLAPWHTNYRSPHAVQRTQPYTLTKMGSVASCLRRIRLG